MKKVKDNNSSSLALASFVISIIALALSPLPIVNNLAFILAILSLILALVSNKKKLKDIEGKPKVTLILSIVAILVVIASQAFYGKAIDEVGKEVEKASEEINESIERSSGNRTDEILNKEVSVEVGEFVVTQADYITETQLPVKVTNKLSELKSYSITIEAVDSNGARIEEDTVYANDLGAGQSQSFKAFQYISSDKIEQLKNATFKILKVAQS